MFILDNSVNGKSTNGSVDSSKPIQVATVSPKQRESSITDAGQFLLEQFYTTTTQTNVARQQTTNPHSPQSQLKALQNAPVQVSASQSRRSYNPFLSDSDDKDARRKNFVDTLLDFG